MPVFVGIHMMPAPVDEKVIENAWSAYKQACEKRGAKAIRVGYNAEKGRGHCITEAPSENVVSAAHEEVGQIPEEIFEIKTLE